VDAGNTATVIVPEEQLSLAIGVAGQNARLAAKLTAWRIDIKSVTEAAFAAAERLSEPPLDRMVEELPELVAEAQRILEKKRAERIIVQEEYHTLGRFVQLAEQRMLESRSVTHTHRRKALDKAKPVVPRHAFLMKLDELELEKDLLAVLRSKNVQNVGDLMTRLLVEEERIREALIAAGADDARADDDMAAMRDAIAAFVLARPASAEPEPAEEEVAEAQTAEAILSADGAAVAPDVAVAPVVEEEEAPPAFIDDERPQPRRTAGAPVRTPYRAGGEAGGRGGRPAPPEAEPAIDLDEVALEAARKAGKPGEKGKERVFDENRGEVVTKRKRKGGRNRGWGDDEE
jgi:N utilization substance protein A